VKQGVGERPFDPLAISLRHPGQRVDEPPARGVVSAEQVLERGSAVDELGAQPGRLNRGQCERLQHGRASLFGPPSGRETKRKVRQQAGTPLVGAVRE
jgi:hypothetical protein